MPLQNGIHSIIHEASSAITSAYTYTQVYAGSGAAPTINGIAVTMAAGSTIDILVKSISATAGIYVLGDTLNTTDPGGTEGKIL